MSMRLSLSLLIGVLVLPPPTVGQETDDDNHLPLFELDEMEVFYSPLDFAPTFKDHSPRFSYFDIPTIPAGDLIVALEFMDRYRETLVPGQTKWAGMLVFPVIDGLERRHIKWICLYYYNDRMYGFDPCPEAEWQRRFAVPLRFEDRKNQELLFRFAENYVLEAFPEWQREFMSEGVYETIDIPAGRIDGFLKSHRGKSPEELVRLVYEYREVPNSGTGVEPVIGEAEGVGKGWFSLAGFFEEVMAYDNYIELAAALLKPRWTQVVRFHFAKQILFWELDARPRCLLFNIGMQVYTYSPRYGVWRTEATLYDLEDPDVFTSKLGYPGVEELRWVEILNPELDQKGAS